MQALPWVLVGQRRSYAEVRRNSLEVAQLYMGSDVGKVALYFNSHRHNQEYLAMCFPELLVGLAVISRCGAC